MNKKLFIAIALLAIIVGIFALAESFHSPATPPVEDGDAAASHTSAAYTIDGMRVKLSQGFAEVPAAPGSSSMMTIRYFGNEAVGDLNGDGTEDIAFLLTEDPGGSGTFYYIVAALKTLDGYRGTNAIIVGDRIAPQTTRIENGIVTLNFADRKKDEPMTTPPSIGITRHYRVEGETLIRTAE